MGKIILLDELTINKIAAGEVIERPASVIKEMVENSIDAKATSVTVEIRNGGISYIKITDNGKGIAQDDLEMAFERHATSKIRSAEDLNSVMSMGFRGEALASIAAISNVELISKTESQETGYKVTVEGGHVLNKEEVGCQTGTTITVKNLFFNTPVRYKFLKKDYTETGYIEDVITRIALINPNVAIKLVNTGKTIISTSGNGNLRDVVYSIYGKDVAQGILDVDYKYEDVKISGVIGKPEISRSNRSNQLFFVNNRYIKDRILTSATEQAYKNLMEIGKFAFVVLNLEIPPHKVDVNVHPAKLEVRFEEENKIFKAVYHAIEDTLAKANENKNDIVKIDNIIIQENKPVNIYEKRENTDIKEEKEKRFGSFLNKRKNNYGFGYENNIIEALYNEKKEEQYPEFKADNIENNKVEETNQNEDNIVNTSDVLQELKSINENIKKDLEKETLKSEEPKEKVEAPSALNAYATIENNNLPDGSTYTYVGENKEKIESLLRQLHPEKFKDEIKVADNNENYNAKDEETVEVSSEIEEKTQLEEVEEENKKTPGLNQKFELIRQNLEKLDANKQETMPFKAVDNIDMEQTQKVILDSEMLEEKTPVEEKKQVNESPELQEGTDTANSSTASNITFNSMYEKLFGTPVIEDKDEEEKVEKEQEKEINASDIVNENVSMFEGIEEFNKPTYKIIGIVFDSYIVAEIEKEMYIINEKIAREKILFEKLKKSYENTYSKDSQMLLLPDIITLNSKDMEVARENRQMFIQAGFILEDFGDDTIKLSGVPTACLELNTKELFYQIVEAINTVARTSKQEKEEKFIETIAQTVANKENAIATIQEAENLMDNLLQLKDPFVYVYNKQVAIKMTKYDIERKFSRK